jgi:hypothetical protein
LLLQTSVHEAVLGNQLLLHGAVLGDQVLHKRSQQK